MASNTSKCRGRYMCQIFSDYQNAMIQLIYKKYKILSWYLSANENLTNAIDFILIQASLHMLSEDRLSIQFHRGRRIASNDSTGLKFELILDQILLKHQYAAACWWRRSGFWFQKNVNFVKEKNILQSTYITPRMDWNHHTWCLLCNFLLFVI